MHKLGMVFATAALVFGGYFVTQSWASAASGNACNNACKQSYRRCVSETSNPGGLNQCRRTYEACLENCP